MGLPATMNTGTSQSEESGKSGYNRFLLLVAGLGGLLYGIDVGIISGALPYLQDTFKLPDGSVLSAQQSSLVVAAVFLGTIFSTLVAGMFADLFGRRTMLVLSGLLFVISVPVIALAHSYDALIFGRLLQGISVGFIGVVAPLYLAECLSAANRGKGTGVFQWLLTLGIVAGADCHLLQHVARPREGTRRRGEALCGQGPRLAQHLLGFAAAGSVLRTGQPAGPRVASLALPSG